MTGIFTIGGFKQTERHAGGMDAVQRELDERYRPFPQTEVYDMRTWKADMRGLAALAKRDGVTRAIIAGYSHGGGYGAPRLAKALIKRGIEVSLVLLCDPVYRPLWLPRWTIAQIFAFRALIPNSAKIKFPPGTGPIWGIRQDANIPQGHQIKVQGHILTLPLVKGVKHCTIDESPQWADLVRRKVNEYV